MTVSKKITTAFLAAAVFAGALGSVGRAQAASLTPGEAALLAGVGGFVVGTIAAEHRHHRRHGRVIVVRDTWEAHVNRCYARYATYDETTDTFIGYDGLEHRCRL